MTALLGPTTADLDGVGAAAVSTAPRRRLDLMLYAAVAWFAVIGLCALFEKVLPLAETSASVGDPRVPPFHHWPEFLGTDSLGRSVLSRVVDGARVSLAVGIAGGSFGILIGGALGVLAGMSRKAFDMAAGLGTEALQAFPGLVFLVFLASVMGSGIRTVIIGLSILAIPGLFRITRANTMRFAEAEFVLAARALGASRSRIIFREILPNVVPPLLAYLPVIVAGLIVAEAGLSFLGLGVVPPTPSWGGQIAVGQRDFSESPFLVWVPAIPLVFTAFSISIIGERLRVRFDRV